MKAVVALSTKLQDTEMLFWEKYREEFAENGVELSHFRGYTEDELIEGLKDADIVLDMLQPITKRVIDSLDHCKAIIRTGVGFNNIDLAAAGAKGIAVCNSPDHCSREVAVLNVTHILNCVEQLSRYSMGVKMGEWPIFPPVRRLSCMTIGLIGFGRISRLIAGYLLPFGCTVAAYDPLLDDAVFADMGVMRYDLDELFANADVISVQVPLLPSTRHIINRENLAKMKDGVAIVNTGRGGLVNEADLAEAIHSGKVAAYGCDVIENEPIRDVNHPLVSLPQVSITPHVGYRGVEAMEELEQKTAQHVITVAKGEIPYTCVNRAELGL